VKDVNKMGMGALMGLMRGNEDSVKTWKRAEGKKIKALRLDPASNKENGALVFTMEDGYQFEIIDNGQTCCESRYMTTDDDLSAHEGATLLDAEVREGNESEDEHYEVHEIDFLVVTTSAGQFAVETHNEHNGYYGGFDVRCRTMEQASTEDARAVRRERTF